MNGGDLVNALPLVGAVVCSIESQVDNPQDYLSVTYIRDKDENAGEMIDQLAERLRDKPVG